MVNLWWIWDINHIKRDIYGEFMVYTPLFDGFNHIMGFRSVPKWGDPPSHYRQVYPIASQASHGWLKWRLSKIIIS